MAVNSLSFPALLDTDDTVSSEYGVLNVPVTFFIDKDGIIQLRRSSPFSNITDIESNLFYIML